MPIMHVRVSEKLRVVRNRAVQALLFLAAFSVVMQGFPGRAHALTVNPSAQAKVSFTFDDGYKSALTKAAPVLNEFGFKGTEYVITNYASNTSRVNYMRWNEIQQLQNQYGWEIGSHTVSHPLMTTVTDQEKERQVRDSKAALTANGINATSFATPYGDYNNSVISIAAKYYASHRGFWDTGYNAWPNNDYLIRDQQVQSGVTVNQVKAYIDQAKANGQWLVLVFHNIKDTPSTNPQDYEYGTQQLREVAAYVKSLSLPVVKVRDGLVQSDTNMLANGSFNSGIASGWSTDTSSMVTLDSANNGSYPDAAKSVKITSGATNAHLFAPKTDVDPNTTYMFKTYLNLQTISAGEVGYYIDEYDANGNWISGRFVRAEKAASAQNINITYKPTSANVKKASLQVYATPNQGIVAYLDNVQMFPLSTETPPPPPPPPVVTNLLMNGTFDNGLGDGWHTDSPTNITADSANHGSPANPINAVSLKAGSTASNSHLFSPLVSVDSTKNYQISSYLNLVQRTNGVVGYYIDEYDANGNWISGQYKDETAAIGITSRSFTYKPTSANVKKASLQVIVVGNSGIVAYFDDAIWAAL